MTADEALEKAIECARSVGVATAWRTCEPYQWDGKTIALLYVEGRKQTASNVFHDIAHFQVAAPSRRQLPDFGLGMGPESSKWTKSVVPEIDGEEEQEASLLGIAHEYVAGMDWQKTFADHCWDDKHGQFWGHVWPVVVRLEKMGLLVDGKPTHAVRQSRKGARP